MEKILQQILSSVTNINGKIDNMKKNHDTRFNQIEEKISKIGQEVGKNGEDIRILQHEMEKNGEDIRILQQEVTIMGEYLYQEIEKVNQEIKSLKNRFNYISKIVMKNLKDIKELTIFSKECIQAVTYNSDRITDRLKLLENKSEINSKEHSRYNERLFLLENKK